MAMQPAIRVGRTVSRTCWIAFALAAGPSAESDVRSAEPAEPQAVLRFVPTGDEFLLDTGTLRGTLRAGGKSQGLLPLTDTASGANLARSLGILSPYRMLAKSRRYGDAAWTWPSRAALLASGAVEVRWSADEEHPFDMIGEYRAVATDTLDLQLTIVARQPLSGFELFLASYFEGFPAAFACVRRPESSPAAGKAGFVEALPEDGPWQTFPRDEGVVPLVRDGRWDCPPHPVDWTIRSPLAAPLAIRRDAASGLTAVLMSSVEDCFAISMPYGAEAHRSVYLSLFGRDFVPGEQDTARVRVVLRRGISDDEAVALYEGFVASGSKGPLSGRDGG